MKIRPNRALIMQPRLWRRLERNAVAGHQKDLLDSLRTLAADHVPVGRIDLRTGPLKTAVLDLPSQRLVLGGFSPTTVDLLSRISCIEGAVALSGAGRYGPYWWIRLSAQGSEMALLAAQLRLQSVRPSAATSIRQRSIGAHPSPRRPSQPE